MHTVIRHTRLEMGLKAAEVAKLADMYPSTYSAVETGGKAGPSVRRRISHALECPEAWLFDEAGWALEYETFDSVLERASKVVSGGPGEDRGWHPVRSAPPTPRRDVNALPDSTRSDQSMETGGGALIDLASGPAGDIPW